MDCHCKDQSAFTVQSAGDDDSAHVQKDKFFMLITEISTEKERQAALFLYPAINVSIPNAYSYIGKIA